REEGASIDGLLVFDHVDNLAAIDLREANYDRRTVLPDQIALAASLVGGSPIFVYEAHQEVPFHPDPPMILQSYLDAVMQGFLVEHGSKGLRRFVEETHNFDTPIYRDRDAPAYPRAVRLGLSEADLFDRLLMKRGATFVEMRET
ncbi:MAG: gamma-glutamylcyclotransferase, partial [Phyllobacterium sp.]